MAIEGIFLVSGLLLMGSITSALDSPCPNLFHYDSTDKPGQWSGTLTLLSDAQLQGVWLRLIFDGKLTSLETDEFEEKVVSADGKEILLKNRNYILKAATPKELKLNVKYEGSKAPQLIGFRLNAKIVCSLDQSDSLQAFAGDYNNEEFLPSVAASAKPLEESPECGTVSKEAPWPWQASLADKKSFICEATLISPRHLLTPAHCVTFQKTELSVPPRSLTVSLGQDKFPVEQILVHPGYRSSGLLNDIAVIQLNAPVLDRIRPVCLGKIGEKNNGNLIGYGINPEEKNDDLAQATVEIAGGEECSKKQPQLEGLLSDNVICLRYKEDKSACVGSSGSSFVTLRDGRRPSWELRGVVSVGVALQNKYVCDGSSAVLAVDVARYLKWIQAIIS